MNRATQEYPAAELVWTEAEWERFERAVRLKALAAKSPQRAWKILARAARRIMACYSTSFFLVSRFLPPCKRRMVEAVYAAVRYPDEVVDSFPLAPAERLERIDRWAERYEEALRLPGPIEALAEGVPAFLAAFADVARRTGIPAEHYRAFLDAMRRDADPQPYRTLDDLIERYVYGSAIVVGYFLGHIYGPAAPGDFSRMMECSRDLGIALQLTNFVRDVRDDQRQGRLYLPLDFLREAGAAPDEWDSRDNRLRLHAAVQRMAQCAEALYASARLRMDAFAPDCRFAIRACIDVYSQLNRRILHNPASLDGRESVPFLEKWRALPPSKYLRVPLALIVR
ncbi:MAG: 15-cis-phytoene synthase [candidate division BRC1 bacterium ADurb.BinA364]|nr:MAG: 15-cis-phytoene synthase [candidate division BRC1 bacterium ADurb.BinA364]